MLMSRSKAITSDDGAGMVLCSSATPSACCVAMTAMYRWPLLQRAAADRGADVAGTASMRRESGEKGRGSARECERERRARRRGNSWRSEMGETCS